MTTQSVYVSITGLQLKARRHQPRFWWHAIRSMIQARKAPGNLSTDARLIDGVHHTRTAWTDEAAMRRYLVAGAHLQAMKAFGAIATGKTLGFTTDALPDWDEVHRLWQTEGRSVGRTATEARAGGIGKAIR
ncbi:hypothetical protein C8J36_107107 [Rhizobium sp. PP-F2F-G48]|uniref:hypothetical protein n=1 Tax=Rhizobium sp. PP-F2F-G48 TaxID=2135651 RepID=UPI0010497D64|nr:hypothetical protein [Rhizobium sp. PP-F2F-G48]TCM53145.1 hypothetical protein C8J36_107107 [Rhizobium sp. PP-F2F-G48]